jgi:hypothetical protein
MDTGQKILAWRATNIFITSSVCPTYGKGGLVISHWAMGNGQWMMGNGKTILKVFK